jgi:repressor LexA
MCHLKALEKKGLIRRTPKESRAIELLGNAKHPSKGLPLRGRVAAGTLHEAIELDERINFGEMFTQQDWYVLEISGDSMIEAQIADGDYIVVEPRATAERGEMVVARTDTGEATLKYWFPEKNRIRLQPANSSMDPIYVKHAEVLGAVVGVVRRL